MFQSFCLAGSYSSISTAVFITFVHFPCRKMGSWLLLSCKDASQEHSYNYNHQLLWKMYLNAFLVSLLLSPISICSLMSYLPCNNVPSCCFWADGFWVMHVKHIKGCYCHGSTVSVKRNDNASGRDENLSIHLAVLIISTRRLWATSCFHSKNRKNIMIVSDRTAGARKLFTLNYSTSITVIH